MTTPGPGSGRPETVPAATEPDEQHRSGDRVEYVGAPVFDQLIRTGDVGVVTSEDDGWVSAEWPRGGVHSVPKEMVRRLGS